MKSIIISLTIFMNLSITSFALGAEWSVSWSGKDDKFQSVTIIDEQELPFTVGRFKCKASKINLDKIYNDVFERRTVSCQMSKDTFVSTDLSYNVKSNTCNDTRALAVYDKDKVYFISLFVQCR